MSIHVAARALLYERQARKGLMGSVFFRGEEQQTRFVADIRVPLVDHASQYTEETLQDIVPGEYLIQLSLPNGGVITQNFTVQAGEDTRVIITIPHEGPHEWSSLHAMTGKFAQEAVATGGYMRPMAARSQSYAQLSADPESGYALSWLAPDQNPADGMLSGDQVLRELGELMSRAPDVRSATAKLGTAIPVEEPSLEDGDFALFRFKHGGLQAGESTDDEDFFLGPGSNMDRRFLLQQSAFGAQLISLPTPWTTPQGQEVVELLIKKHSIFEELDYAMTIGDPMINTLLGYINMGAVHLAQRLLDVEQAQQMLYEKISYPLAATIGGYVLVLGRNTGEYRSQADVWKSWVENLDHWFEWLPDGAILNASMQLMEKQPDLEKARDALMRAFSRGLPYFTFGLKQLLDGMRFFAGKGDAEAQGCLDVLKVIAAGVDSGSPFLTVTVASSWEEKKKTPTLEMRYG
ncbi:hypothetical protein [Thiolapillus sp.]|uniref:hypothetical protein n=10 Tax=Thiolapillus sp. TaxID=2017437 RepID=UPI0025FBB14A|nr:hypothetical protein [Thiolapillus sp.]